MTYPGPLTPGSHTFSVKAQDSAGNLSSATSFTWTINTTAPPIPTITSTPANPTNQTGASFSFSDTQTGVSFLCQLDSSAFTACTSPATYSALSQGSHTFSVKAQDSAGNQSGATSFTWTINTTAPPKPTITSAPTTLNYSSSFFVGTPDGAGISSVALIGNGAVTHSFNMDQRFVPLTFTQTGGGLTVQAPANANLAPPGYYMLFTVNSNGVPSVAPFVRLPAPY